MDKRENNKIIKFWDSYDWFGSIDDIATLCFIFDIEYDHQSESIILGAKIKLNNLNNKNEC